MIGNNNTVSFQVAIMKTQEIQLLRLQQIRVVGTFSSDLTLSASAISDRTAEINHQNQESAFR